MISLDAKALHNLLASEHEFTIKITKLMAWRVQKSQEMLILMKLGNPCLRVVAGICQFAEALAYGDGSSNTIDDSTPITIPAPQGYVAALCGVSRGTLSVFIQHLAEQGCLRISYGKLELLKPKTWFRFAELQRSRSVDSMNPSIGDLIQDFKDIESGQVCSSGDFVGTDAHLLTA
jgi:CRP-like cAMP-binding protein